MPRDYERDHIRERIAHLAARLMAEDGIDDHALAKRKAARQAGVAGTRCLPNNEEIDAALHAYQQIFQHDDQPQRLRALRLQAVSMMRVLERFSPHLTGSVLSGLAGKFAGISLQLFTDSVKDVELFLLNRHTPYRSGENRFYIGDELRSVPLFVVDQDGVEIRISVFGMRDQRLAVKASPAGKPIERARLESVESLL